MSFAEFLNKLILAAYGLPFVGGILAFMWYRVASVRWQPLAEYYCELREKPIARRHMQTLIIHSSGLAYERYGGIAVVGVCESGVRLRLYPPFSIFHTPLFIPFGDISARKRQWFLFKAVEITVRKAPDTKIVIYPELWEWIEELANGRPADDRYYSSSKTPRLAALT